jgi:hypothetical protein
VSARPLSECSCLGVVMREVQRKQGADKAAVAAGGDSFL